MRNNCVPPVTMIPILSQSNRFDLYDCDYYLTINSDSLVEFLEKYVIQDCPYDAEIHFYVHPPVKYFNQLIDRVSFVKANNHFFRFNSFRFNTIGYVFGISEKMAKHKEELMQSPYFHCSYRHAYYNHDECDIKCLKWTLVLDNLVESHNLCSLLLNKFTTFSRIELRVCEPTYHCLDIFPVDFTPLDTLIPVIGFLSEFKMSGEEKYKINHKYILKNIYDFQKIRVEHFDEKSSYNKFYPCVVLNHTYPADINITYNHNNNLQIGKSFSQILKNYPLNLELTTFDFEERNFIQPIQFSNNELMTISNQYFFEFEIISYHTEMIGIMETSLEDTCYIWGLDIRREKKVEKIGMHLDILNGKLCFYQNERYRFTHPMFFQKNVQFNLYFIFDDYWVKTDCIKVLRSFKYPTNLQYLCCVKLREMNLNEKSIGEITNGIPGLKSKLQNNFGWFL